MTNHVPNEALDALDRFGDGLLTGAPPSVGERLRSDLRLRIDGGAAVTETGTTRVAFHFDHARREGSLRDYGSFVCTIVDGVDDRLREWGVEPPATYEFVGVEAGWLVFAGTAQVLAVSG
jgi:hypothetical protein